MWFVFQGCQPFLIPPCHRTYECSTKNSKVPECWENTCDPNVNNLNKTGIYDGESFMKMQSKIMKISILFLCLEIIIIHIFFKDIKNGEFFVPFQT